MPLEPGSPAPDFEAEAHDGSMVKLSEYRGRIVVLYFYPRAFTSGCTREAERFNRLADEFEKLGVVILGVSPDSRERAARFAEKLGLRFRLIPDPELRIARLYGVEKRTRSGRLSVERVTFVIGPDGVIRAVFRGVRPAEKHADLALEEARRLAASPS